MNLPDISMWNAGTQHDEDTFNAVSYAMSFLLAPPECKVVQTSAQTIPIAGANTTALTWNSAAIDNDGMWNASNPTYLTIQTSGWYEIEWAVCWANKADTTERFQNLHVNGDFVLANGYAYNDYLNTGGGHPEVWMTYDMFLSQGDTLAVGVMQLSGATLNTAPSSTLKDQQTFLRVRWSSL